MTRISSPIVTLWQDTRERTPWVFPPEQPVEIVTGPFGDYGGRPSDQPIEMWIRRIAIERKSTADLIGSSTFERPRFERELDALAGFERACIIVEGDLDELITGRYRSTVSPQAMVGSLGSYFGRYGIATVFAGSARNGAILARSFITKAVKHLLAAESEAA